MIPRHSNEFVHKLHEHREQMQEDLLAVMDCGIKMEDMPDSLLTKMCDVVVEHMETLEQEYFKHTV